MKKNSKKCQNIYMVLKSKGILIMNQSKNKMIGDRTERKTERITDKINERPEHMQERNERFLPIIYWTD